MAFKLKNGSLFYRPCDTYIWQYLKTQQIKLYSDQLKGKANLNNLLLSKMVLFYNSNMDQLIHFLTFFRPVPLFYPLKS